MMMVAVDSPGKQPKRGLGGPEADSCFPVSASNSRKPIMVKTLPCADRCVVMVSIEALDVMSNA